MSAIVLADEFLSAFTRVTDPQRVRSASRIRIAPAYMRKVQPSRLCLPDTDSVSSFLVRGGGKEDGFVIKNCGRSCVQNRSPHRVAEVRGTEDASQSTGMSIAAQGDELVSFRRSTGARLRGRWCTVSRVGAVSVFLFVVRLFLKAVLVPTALVPQPAS